MPYFQRVYIISDSRALFILGYINSKPCSVSKDGKTFLLLKISIDISPSPIFNKILGILKINGLLRVCANVLPKLDSYVGSGVTIFTGPVIPLNLMCSIALKRSSIWTQDQI